MQETILLVDNSIDTSEHPKIQALEEHIDQHRFMPCSMKEAASKVTSPDLHLCAVLIEIPTSEQAAGLHTIASLRAVNPSLPVIVLVSYGDEELAIKALKAGAHDFLTKPVPASKLRLALQHALMIRHMQGYITRLESYVLAQLDALPEGGPEAPLGHLGGVLLDEKGQIKPLKSVEQDIIRFVLHHTNGCMARAARSLGIGRSTLYRKVSELDMHPYMARANHTARPTIQMSSRGRSSAE